MDLTKCNT